MNGKRAKAARRNAAQAGTQRTSRSGFSISRRGTAVAVAVVAVMAASFVVPGLFGEESTPENTSHAAMESPEVGTGLVRGSVVPAFAEHNVETGAAITSKSLAGEKTLLFFSEGVMCQACLQQIKDLEQMDIQLERRGIGLVSITPDSPAELKQAIRQYAITSPLIADDDGDMSAAFNTLGKGMHGNSPGHAFALIDQGKVAWYHDYWLPPERTMYVDPAKVLADLESA